MNESHGSNLQFSTKIILDRNNFYLSLSFKQLKSLIQFLRSSRTSICLLLSTVEVSTICFSRRLIRGVGNRSYTTFFSAIRINLNTKRSSKYLIEIADN